MGDGAVTDLGPTPTLARVRPAAPSRTDPVVRRLSGVVGGPAGRRLRPGSGLWRAFPVLVVLAAVTLGLGVVQKAHCVNEGWSTPDQFWHACYSDIPVLYVSQGLGGPEPAGLPQVLGAGGLGQPPLAAALMWVVARVTDAVDGAVGGATSAALAPRQYFLVSAVLLTGVLIAAVLAVAAAAGRRRVWDAAHLAVAPVLLTVGLLSYELVAVAFVAVALWAWSRSRPLAAGVALGLAVCTRPVTAMAAVGLLAVCLRAGRWRAWAVTAGAALGVWVAVRLVLFGSPLGALNQAWEAWKASTPGYGSLWLAPQLLSQSRPASAGAWYTGPGVGAGASSMITMLGLTAVVVATVLLALSSRFRPRTAHLVLFALAGALLVTKSYPVQASLLLLPALALSALPWRDHLLWAAAEALHFVGVWLFIAASSDADRGLPAGFYLLLVLLRIAATVWLMVQAVRLARDPVADPVRVPVDPLEGGPGADDPVGGVVDDAPDALVVRVR